MRYVPDFSLIFAYFFVVEFLLSFNFVNSVMKGVGV